VAVTTAIICVAWAFMVACTSLAGVSSWAIAVGKPGSPPPISGAGGVVGTSVGIKSVGLATPGKYANVAVLVKVALGVKVSVGKTIAGIRVAVEAGPTVGITKVAVPVGVSGVGENSDNAICVCVAKILVASANSVP
jgi:hypothetical protein